MDVDKNEADGNDTVEEPFSAAAQGMQCDVQNPCLSLPITMWADPKWPPPPSGAPMNTLGILIESRKGSVLKR